MTLVTDGQIQSRVRKLNWAIAKLQVMKYVTRHDLRRANCFLANRNVTADYKINGPKVSKKLKKTTCFNINCILQATLLDNTN